MHQNLSNTNLTPELNGLACFEDNAHCLRNGRLTMLSQALLENSSFEVENTIRFAQFVESGYLRSHDRYRIIWNCFVAFRIRKQLFQYVYSLFSATSMCLQFVFSWFFFHILFSWSAVKDDISDHVSPSWPVFAVRDQFLLFFFLMPRDHSDEICFSWPPSGSFPVEFFKWLPSHLLPVQDILSVFVLSFELPGSYYLLFWRPVLFITSFPKAPVLLVSISCHGWLANHSLPRPCPTSQLVPILYCV